MPVFNVAVHTPSTQLRPQPGCQRPCPECLQAVTLHVFLLGVSHCLSVPWLTPRGPLLYSSHGALGMTILKSHSAPYLNRPLPPADIW